MKLDFFLTVKLAGITIGAKSFFILGRITVNLGNSTLFELTSTLWLKGRLRFKLLQVARACSWVALSATVSHLAVLPLA